jgi:CheY-like chemotaxis protein
MGKPIRVLLVEDSERDAALLNLYLKRAGFDATIRRVEKQTEMVVLVKNEAWDVVISDFNLPGFNAHTALKTVQDSGKRIPFIVLSGEVAKNVIDGILQAGASEYVCKYEMAKIAPAIERAIEAATA